MVKSSQRAKAYWKKLIRYGIARKEFRPVEEDVITDIILFSYQGVRMWSQIIKLEPSVAGNIAEPGCLIRTITTRTNGER